MPRLHLEELYSNDSADMPVGIENLQEEVRMSSSHCLCQKAQPDKSDTSSLISRLARVRDACPAVREVFIPDWNDFMTQAGQPIDEATHQSMLLLGLQRGVLGRLTAPIHRFLMDGDNVRPELTKQYRRDLRERWMLKEEILERHRKGRMYSGKIAELQCALNLEEQGWEIKGLEALGGTFDIEAGSAFGEPTAFEVKMIGLADDDFLATVRSLSNGPEAYSLSPYAAGNYLLFRAFEAANQLRRCRDSSIILLVISQASWDFLSVVVEDNWIPWGRPIFLDEAKKDERWRRFFDQQKVKYPELDTAVATAFLHVHEVRILRQSVSFEYTLEKRIPMN